MDRLSNTLTTTLVKSVPDAIQDFVQAVIGPRRPLGVLFYGAGLRTTDPHTLLDFYAIVDDMDDWGWRNPLITAAGRLLPPNVVYVRHKIAGREMHAKIAVLTHAQFVRLTRRLCHDSSVWARFCQPSRLVWVRDDQAADQILGGVRQAVLTAAWWAACFSPAQEEPSIIWARLFLATYRNELRPEGKGRAHTLIRDQEAWFADILAAAWAELGLTVMTEKGHARVAIAEETRRKMLLRWRRMRTAGRWRNAARLCKAAFTYIDGAAYLADKIARHHGLDLRLSSFELRHPILCLPVLLWRGRAILLKR